MRRLLALLLCLCLIPAGQANDKPAEAPVTRRGACLTAAVGIGAVVTWLLTRDRSPKTPLQEWQAQRKATGLNPKSQIDLMVLGQMHRNPLAEMGRGDDPEETIQTIDGQLRVLIALHQLMAQQKPLLVFDEGLVETLTPELRRTLGAELDKLPPPPYDNPTIARLKARFPDSALAAMVGARQYAPKGIKPEHFDRVTRDQAMGLLVISGARIWWAIGEIDTLYPTATAAMMTKTKTLMGLVNAGRAKRDDPKVRYHFYPERERDALGLVFRVANQHPDALPVLLYGGDHNYPQYDEPGILKVTQKKLYVGD